MLKRFLIIVILISVGSLCYSRHKFPDRRKKLIKKYPVQSDWKKIEYKGILHLDDSKDESLYKRIHDIEGYKDLLFLVDNNGHSIKIFDFKGKFIRSIGRRGQGPGDLYYPSYISVFDNNIYIKNLNGIDSFDLKGKFKDRIKLFFGCWEFKVMKEGIYVSPSQGYQGKPTIALKLDRKGKVVKIIRSEKLTAPIYKRSSHVFIKKISEHKFIFVMKRWNKIFFYNEKDNILKEKEIPYKFGTELDKKRLNEKFDPKSNTIRLNNYIAGARIYDNKIFILLNVISRFEILALNFKGDIVDHYYNDDKGLAKIHIDNFLIRKEKGVTALYLLAYSTNKDSDNYLYPMIHKATIKD